MNDGAIIKYISVSIRHAYIAFSKKTTTKELPTSVLNNAQQNIVNKYLVYEDFYNALVIQDLVQVLSLKEIQVLNWTCIQNHTPSDVAKILGVSRQNINQIKRSALKKLGKYYSS